MTTKKPPRLVRKEVDISKKEKQCEELLATDGELKFCKFIANHVGYLHETYDGRTWRD